ncbi:hypothetical protein [Saccharopolyspora cebuensis]|uniref:hypothetical protein n=1 Tax=Saccharopolyspora cebuensis TaxID=418759 RepID=UPI0031F035D6
MDGFRVDLTALADASEGVRSTVEAMRHRAVSEIDCPAEAFGHDRLAGITAEFCDRWNRGVSNLAEDAKEVSGRLDHCFQAYRDTDEAARARFEGMVGRSGGGDPAAQ